MDERGRPVVDFAYLKDPKDLQAMGTAVDKILQVIRKENLQVLIPNFDLNPPDTKAVASMMARVRVQLRAAHRPFAAPEPRSDAHPSASIRGLDRQCLAARHPQRRRE